MRVKIGHAVADENKRLSGGMAGNQTSNELVMQDWYLRDKGWSAVFRAKDTKLAEKIAKTMEQACKNNNIGYDQKQRVTLYEKAKEAGWDLSKISNKCECDCSSLVAVCCNVAGVKVSKDMYTGNQKAVLQRTGKFEILTSLRYRLKPDYLRRGDILLGPGHTAIVLSDGHNMESAKSFDKSLASSYKVTADALNVRRGAGVDKKIITSIPKNTEVKCFGYYTRILGTDWLFVQYTYNNKKYTGFVSSKYLTKA